MDMLTRKKLYLVAGRASYSLAEEIAHELDVELGQPNIGEFANGELFCKFSESVRGTDVFIVQTHAAADGRSINDAIMEQLMMVDAAKRASAKRITVVCPFYGYARQDRKASGREPITARLLADLFEAAGAKRMMSVDLHAGQIQGFFNGPVDHLVAMPLLLDVLGDYGDDIVMVSPDTGRVKVAEKYAQALHCDLAFVYKARRKDQKNVVEAKEVIGEVEGRTCVLIDDMIDTGGTIVAAAELLAERGAARVIAACTHGIFSGPAINRLEKSNIERVLCTNTLPLSDDKRIDKIEQLSVAPIIGRAIDAVFRDESVSEIFDGNNLF